MPGAIPRELARPLTAALYWSLVSPSAVCREELGKVIRWDERVGREAIGFLLVLRHARIDNLIAHVFGGIVDHEHVERTVQKDVGQFVEEGKPQLVGPFVSQREPDHRMPIVKPPGAPADSSAGQLRDDEQRHAEARAEKLGSIEAFLDIPGRQQSQFFQRSPELRFVVFFKGYLLGVELGFPDPRGEHELVDLELLRLPVLDGELTHAARHASGVGTPKNFRMASAAESAFGRENFSRTISLIGKLSAHAAQVQALVNCGIRKHHWIDFAHADSDRGLHLDVGSGQE